MAELHQVLNDKATVYTLAGGKAWKETGPSGQLMVYHYRSRPNDILVRWWKSDTSLAYQVSPGHLKSRGANAWVVRAFNMNCSPPVEEIIAIRFQHAESADKFKAHFEKVTRRVYEEKRKRKTSERRSLRRSGFGDLGNHWLCPRCNSLCKMTESVCARCYNPRPSRPTIVKPVVAEDRRKQHVSLTSELADSLPSPRTDKVPMKDWHCAVCTFRNLATDSRCQICGSPNSSIDHSDEDDLSHSGDVHSDSGSVGSPEAHDDRDTGYDLIQRMMREKMGETDREARIRREMEEERMERMAKQKEMDDDLARKMEEHERRMAELRRKQLAEEERLKRLEAKRKSAERSSFKKKSEDYPGRAAASSSASSSSAVASSSSSDPPGSWACPVCTLINKATATVCEVCESPKSMTDQLGFGTMERGTSSATRVRSGSAHSATSLFEVESLASEYGAEVSDVGSKLVRDYERMRTRYTSTSIHSRPSAMSSGSAVDAPPAAKVVTRGDFERVASEISWYNDTPGPVFNTLKGVTKKLLRDDDRYRSLDTTNPKVEERLIGFEGVLDFLYLLGFQGDAAGQKLVCYVKPSEDLVADALEVLAEFEQRMAGFVAMAHGGSGVSGVAGGAGGADMIDAEDEALRLALAESLAAMERQVTEVEEEAPPSAVLAVRKIILWCNADTKHNETMETLFMCYRQFTDPITLLMELRERFFVQIPPEMSEEKEIEHFTNSVMKPVQMNVVRFLRLWMKEYWENDFKGDPDMEDELRDWIKTMEQKVRIYNWIGILAQYVRADLKKYRKYGSKRDVPVDYSGVAIPRRFSIYSLSKNELADQITLMDFRIFSAINPRECLGQRWKKKDGRERSPNVLKMIAQFNNLTKFVQIQILREKSLSNRGKALRRIIKMADRFRETRNYNSLCAVFGALESAPIHRLKLAWEKVPPKEKKLLEEYKVIFSRDYNHRVLRKIFRDAVGSSCIPHIGIFLQDLVFIDDSGEKKDQSTVEGIMDHFSKQVRLAERIKKIQEFQRCPFTKIEEYPVVQKLLIEEFIKLKDITEDIIWDMSTEVKRQDERDKTRFF